MRPTLLVPILLLAGCVPPLSAPAVNSLVKLRPDTGPECAANCETLGMRLSAVVLIHNSAGCVCQPGDAFAPASPGSSAPQGGAPRAAIEPGASAVAGGAYILALEEEEEQQRQQQQQAGQQQLHPTTPYRPPYSAPGTSGASYH